MAMDCRWESMRLELQLSIWRMPGKLQCALLDILQHIRSQLQHAGNPKGVIASSMAGKQITEERMRALCRERALPSSDAYSANNGMPCTYTYRNIELSGGIHWLRLSLCNKF